MTDKHTDKDGLPISDMSDTSELGQSIIQGLREAVLYKRGKLTKGVKVHSFPTEPVEVDVKSIRSNLGLTQEEFAAFIHASPRAVQHWEQHTRQPEGPTQVLLQVLAKNPDVVWDTLQHPDT